MNKMLDLLGDSWKLLVTHYQRFIIFFFFQCLIQLLSPIGEIMGMGPGSMPGVWLELLVAALTIWNFTYLLHILMDIESGKSEDMIELFVQATYDAPAFFLYSLLYGLSIMLGAFLLVIPGFYFMIFNYFAPIASVMNPDSDDVDGSYFKFSRRLVKPHWGKMIIFFIILLVLNGLIPSLGMVPQLADVRLILDIGLIPLEVLMVLVGDILAVQLYRYLKQG